jgi:hypothetical protein
VRTTTWTPERIHLADSDALLALVIVEGTETTMIPLAHSDARRIGRGLLELVDDDAADLEDDERALREEHLN